MNALRNILIVALFYSVTALAEPASDRSIKQLLDVTHVRDISAGTLSQLNSINDNIITQALQGKTLTPEHQRSIANMKYRMLAVIQDEMAWEKLEPMYLRLYRESFTEEEIVSMLSFYKTSAGRALIRKMPVLMQNTMLEIQKTLSRLNPQLLQIREEYLTEIKAACKKND